MMCDPEDKFSVSSVLNDPAAEYNRAFPGKAGKTPLEQAKKWAMDYLKRPHSEKELRDRLSEKGCQPEDIDAVCTLCLDYGFVNDEEYAGSIVRHYSAKGYGPGRIRMELSRRGVPRELWENVLEEMPSPEETLDRLLAARLQGRDFSSRQERDKAANALYRRGFSWEDIRGAMARYNPEETETADMSRSNMP